MIGLTNIEKRFGDNLVLKGVTVTIAEGSVTALVRPSGGGKSTVLSLIMRLYDPQAGAVRVDGLDLREVRQAAWRSHLAFVLQENFLFDASIRDNIRMGRLGASDAEVEAAARAAEIDEVIRAMPAGYDTRVGERGLKLSGGEKQRVAIARTILKDPRILILDEATSALDTRTEQDIQTALRGLAWHRTTLVIAHRLSTVVDSDEIIVLADGRVAERGTHAALLALGGLYARMWALQAAEQEEADITA